MEKSCCFTGYRPKKFPFSLTVKNPQYVAFENTLYEKMLELIEEENCNVFYTGMAMGFDIVAAEAVILLKKAYKKRNIKLICVKPFLDHESGFFSPWKERYQNVIDNADEVVVLSGEYYSGCYQNRNRYMVDNSDFVMTWYDGQKGGTGNTIKYAQKKCRAVINLNNKFGLLNFSQEELIF